MNDAEIFQADVLVIGGGAAGAFAAIKARQNGAERVLLVEKAATGRSGASCFAAGVLMAFIPEEDDLDVWMKEIVEQGQYLNDQEWLRSHLEGTYRGLREIESWGLRIRKTPDGRYARARGRGSHPDKGLRNVMFTGQEGELVQVLRDKAVASGVHIVNWTMLTDLLTSDGRVVGAAGFNARDGNFTVFKSKATVLAAGAGWFRCGINVGHRMVNFDSTSLAFRAGADFINCDFSTVLPFCAEFKMGGMHMTVGLGGKLVNAMGERFMADYDPVYQESATGCVLGNAPLLEARAGRAPIYMDLTHFSPEAVEVFRSVLPLNAMMMQRAGVLVGDRIVRKLEYSLVGPTLGTGCAGIRINPDCETSLPGLLAAGDAAAKMPGGTTSNTLGLPFAFVTGARAGERAAEYARSVPEPEIGRSQWADAMEYALAPMRRSDGVEGDYLIEAVQDIAIPYDVLMLRRGDRMEKALADVASLKEDLLPLLYAHDPHYLRLAHEARSLVLATEIALRAGLVRKESRANIREDYPFQDNVDWLKWVLLKRDPGGRRDLDGMRIWTEDIPIERYPVKPKRERFLHRCLQAAEKRGLLRTAGEDGVQWGDGVQMGDGVQWA